MFKRKDLIPVIVLVAIWFHFDAIWYDDMEVRLASDGTVPAIEKFNWHGTSSYEKRDGKTIRSSVRGPYSLALWLSKDKMDDVVIVADLGSRKVALVHGEQMIDQFSIRIAKYEDFFVIDINGIKIEDYEDVSLLFLSDGVERGRYTFSLENETGVRSQYLYQLSGI